MCFEETGVGGGGSSERVGGERFLPFALTDAGKWQKCSPAKEMAQVYTTPSGTRFFGL